MNNLTKTQAQVLRFISGYIKRERMAPSLHDIRAHFGWSSPNAPMSHLRALERKKHIRRIKNRARGIQIL